MTELRNGAQSNPVDKVIHIADIHFWRVVINPLRLLNKRFLGNLNVWLRRRHEFAMERAELFADTVAAAGIRHVLLTGDFTSTSIDEEFEMARDFVRGLRRRGMEPFVIPGNHDLYTFEAARRKRFHQFFDEFLPEGGYPSRAVLPGGTSLILTPTVCPNLLSAKGRISDSEIAATRRLLADGPPAAIVAGHYPVLHATHGYHTAPSRRLRNADRLRAALGESGRRVLYVCGHVHRFSYTVDDQYADVRHLSTGAFFLEHAKLGQQGEFSEIHVCDDGWRVFRHRHTGAWVREEVQPANP
ncbi:MAG: metallophosphoesterase [Candidatus Hydrogenedentes bacterium]|nr:metallophosphoesterase [Candidatus Hydrogenedentota bacterium]